MAVAAHRKILLETHVFVAGGSRIVKWICGRLEGAWRILKDVVATLSRFPGSSVAPVPLANDWFLPHGEPNFAFPSN